MNDRILVKAEIRDIPTMKKKRILCILPLLLWLCILFILIAGFSDSVIQAIDAGNVIVIVLTLLYAISLVPLIVVTFIKASKGYNETWINDDFEFIAKENHIYYKDKQMHVNYSAINKEIYIHDLKSPKPPYKVTFYATIKDDQFSEMYRFICSNNIEIEREYLMPASGANGELAIVGFYAKYRR